jgi:FAD/FMN-containing dehydrogenase
MQAMDHVVGLEVVLANGTQVTVSQSSYPDLFWAMRGAGSSFGIITSYILSTDQASTQLIRFQEFVQSGIPATLGAEITLAKGNSQGQVAYTFNGAYFGDAASFNSTIAPYLSSFPVAPSSNKVTSGSWIEAMQNLANGQNLNTTLDGSDYSDNFCMCAQLLNVKTDFKSRR